MLIAQDTPTTVSSSSLQPSSPQGRAHAFRLLADAVVDYAIFLLDPEGYVLTWNPGAERAKGYQASEIIGRHFSVFYPPEDIAAHRPQHGLEVAARQGRFETEGWRVRKDGTRFWANVVITALRDEQGRLAGFGKVTRDLTARRAAEETARRLAEERAAKLATEAAYREIQRLALRTTHLQAVTAAFARAIEFDEVVEIIRSQVLPALDGDGGSLALVSEDGETLELAWTQDVPDEHVRTFARFPVVAPLPHSMAFRTKEPLLLDSAEAIVQAFPQFAGSNHLSALVSLPLCAGQTCIGVLGASWREPRSFSREEREFSVALAQQCAQALLRARLFDGERRARQAADDARRRLALVSEASRLVGSSLDYDATLNALTRLVVPQFADWCAVELVEDNGTSRQVAVGHVDEEKVRYAWELRDRYPPNPKSERGVPNVLRTGRAELYEEIPDAFLVEGAIDAEHLRISRALGIKSALVVPLRVVDRVIGALTLVSAESGRRYGAGDVALAQELATRAALAVENARLYRRAQEAIGRRDEFLSESEQESNKYLLYSYVLVT